MAQDAKKTKAQLLSELKVLRLKIEALEYSKKAFKESEGRYKSLTENTPDIIIRFDRACRHLYVSPAAWLYGTLKPEEFVGKTHKELNFPEDQALLWESNIKSVFKTGKPFETEVEFDSIKGPVIFNWRMFPERDKEGNILSVLSVTRDVTKRWQAEKAVYWQRQALEQSSDGICITDMNGNIEFVNTSWASMHGYEINELDSKNLEIFHSKEQIKKPVNKFSKKAKKTGGNQGNTYHVRKDGTTFPIRTSVTVLTNKQGDPVSMVVIAHDATEELMLEAQLRQSQKLESLGRLAGGVAHDFNNLLTPILGYADILLLDYSPEDSKYENLMLIKKAAKGSKDLTRRILAFSRTQVLEMKTINLNKVVTGFEKIVRTIIREDIELVIRSAKSLSKIRADKSQVEQIIMNLVVNAQDAMPNGGKMVIETADIIVDQSYVKKNPGLMPGPYVMLTVSDSGIGMAPETLKKTFEPFFTTKGHGKGTGLGLSTVYGIVKQHDGYIYAWSEPGKGSTFKTYFPLTNSKDIRLKSRQTHKKNIKGSETVLVAEDDEISRDAVCSILKKFGYDTIDAETADKCLGVAKLHKGPIHMLLTDVVMPEMNGLELYKKLKVFLPRLKVLYMSGYVGNEVTSHGILDEEIRFIQKPISAHALTGKVREMIDSA